MQEDGVQICAAYTAWNLWNERNRRTFEGAFSDARGVLQLIRDDLALLNEAFWE